MNLTFEDLRSERRSIFCKNTLWKRVQQLAKERNTSTSKYVIQTIEEKMTREEKQALSPRCDRRASSPPGNVYPQKKQF